MPEESILFKLPNNPRSREYRAFVPETGSRILSRPASARPIELLWTSTGLSPHNIQRKNHVSKYRDTAQVFRTVCVWEVKLAPALLCEGREEKNGVTCTNPTCIPQHVSLTLRYNKKGQWKASSQKSSNSSFPLSLLTNVLLIAVSFGSSCLFKKIYEIFQSKSSHSFSDIVLYSDNLISLFPFC